MATLDEVMQRALKARKVALENWQKVKAQTRPREEPVARPLPKPSPTSEPTPTGAQKRQEAMAEFREVEQELQPTPFRPKPLDIGDPDKFFAGAEGWLLDNRAVAVGPPVKPEPGEPLPGDYVGGAFLLKNELFPADDYPMAQRATYFAFRTLEHYRDQALQQIPSQLEPLWKNRGKAEQKELLSPYFALEHAIQDIKEEKGEEWGAFLDTQEGAEALIGRSMAYMFSEPKQRGFLYPANVPARLAGKGARENLPEPWGEMVGTAAEISLDPLILALGAGTIMTGGGLIPAAAIVFGTGPGAAVGGYAAEKAGLPPWMGEMAGLVAGPGALAGAYRVARAVKPAWQMAGAARPPVTTPPVKKVGLAKVKLGPDPVINRMSLELDIAMGREGVTVTGPVTQEALSAGAIDALSFEEVAQLLRSPATRVGFTESMSAAMSKELEPLLKAVSGDELQKMLMRNAFQAPAIMPGIPASFPGRFYHYMRAFTVQPALGNLTQNSFLSATRYQQSQLVFANIRTTAFRRGLHLAFPEAKFGNVLDRMSEKVMLEAYTGPKVAEDPLKILTTRDTVRLKNTGTIADFMQYPERYLKATPAQKELARIWRYMEQQELALSQLAGVPVREWPSVYMTWRPASTTRDFNLIRSIGGRVVRRGEASFVKERTMPTFDLYTEELLASGLEPEYNVLYLLSQRQMAGAVARSERIYLSNVAREFKVPGATKRGYMEVAGEPIEVVPLFPGKNNTLVPRRVAEETQRFATPRYENVAIDKLHQGLDTARAALLSFDFSFIGIQGFALFTSNPMAYLKGASRNWSRVLTQEGFVLDTAQNLEAYALFAQSGGSLYMSAIDIPKTALGAQRTLVERIPILNWTMETQFNRFLPKAKLEHWRSSWELMIGLQAEKGLGGAVQRFLPEPARRGLKRFGGLEGRSPQELLNAAADVVNNIGGGIDWTVVGSSPATGSWGLVRKFTLLTEGWLRANVGRIVNATKTGDPRGLLARRFLMQQLSITAGLSSSLSMAFSGRMPNFDPRATDFLDIQMADGSSIAILPGKTYIRQVARVLGGTPWEAGGPAERALARFESTFRNGESKTGHIFRLGVDLYTGKDWLGRKVQNKYFHILQSLAPIVIQEFTEGLQRNEGVGPSVINALPELAGVARIPPSPFETRDQKLSDLYVEMGGDYPYKEPLSGEPITTYRNLPNWMRGDFDENFPEFTEATKLWHAERDTGSGQLNMLRQDRDGDITGAGELFEGAGPEYGDGRLYRESIAEANAEYLIRSKKIRDEMDYEDEDVLPWEEVINNYYEEVVEASLVDDELDNDIYEVNERAYRAKLNDKQVGVLDQYLGYSTDPVYQRLREDRILLRPYWQYRDAIWCDYAIEKAGLPEWAKEYDSYESFVRNAKADYTRGVEGKSIADFITNPETRQELEKLFGTGTLSFEQASRYAEMITSSMTRDFVTMRSNLVYKFLETEENGHTMALALERWDYRDIRQEYIPLLGEGIVEDQGPSITEKLFGTD